MPEALTTSIPSDPAALETLMRRHNARLFRVARAILKDDASAEDALQDAYVLAFRRSDQFRGDAELSTWLTRIVINQALMMLRKRKRERIVVPFRNPGADAHGERTDDMANEVPDHKAESPSEAALRGEVRRVIERRIDQLPIAFRTVFVMREVEEMTVQETAECLGIPPSTARTRLF